MYRFICILLFLEVFLQSFCVAGGPPEAPMINNQDTVVFDLSQAVCASGTMDFPMFIITDEPVYAIDFSLKFDPANLTYLSITNLKPYLITSAWFNSTDSTLRFSSFSMQPIDNDTPLVRILFNLPSAQINLASFDSVYTLLNGDNCSNKFINPILPLNIGVVGLPIITPGDSLMLSVNVIPGVNYLWSTGQTAPVIYVNSPGTYSVTVASLLGCSSFSEIEINAPAPLPVALLWFDGEQKNNGIELSWVTSSELNNNYFEIEKATINLEVWQSLCLLNGAGTSNNNNNYSFFDPNPINGYNYYRLKQVDFDGTATYSNILKVIYDDLQRNSLLKIYPNPVSSGRTVQLALPPGFESLDVSLIVSNEIGSMIVKMSVILSANHSEVDPITFEMPLNTPSGTYNATIFSNGKVASCQFILN